VKVAELALDIVKAADVLGEGSLECAEFAVELETTAMSATIQPNKTGDAEASHISELDEAELAEGIDDFAADFVGNVQLHHAHVRRAERRILSRSHRDGWAGR
jgi:hypothetical protein